MALGVITSRRLLVPVGGSSGYRHALAHIEKGGESDRAEVLLLNVRPTLKIGVVSRATSVGRIVEAQRAYGEELMRPAMVWLDERHIQYSAEVEFGSTVEAIIGHAFARGCDAMVIGVDAQRDASALSPGSVASRLLHRSPIPVVVVDENSHRSQYGSGANRSTRKSMKARTFGETWRLGK